METRCLSNLPYIHLLVFNRNRKQRTALIETASAEQIRCVLEIIANLLYGNIRVPKETLQKFKRHRDALVKLWHGRESLQEKKKFLLVHHNLLFSLLNLSRPFFENNTHLR